MMEPNRIWINDKWEAYLRPTFDGDTSGYIRADLATPAPAAVTPEVAKLVDAVEALNAACDAMWNDHHRLEGNLSLFGQEMRIKERHVKAITEAQQRLPAILAILNKEKPYE